MYMLDKRVYIDLGCGSEQSIEFMARRFSDLNEKIIKLTSRHNPFTKLLENGYPHVGRHIERDAMPSRGKEVLACPL